MSMSRRAWILATVAAITAGLVLGSPTSAGAGSRPVESAQVSRATQAQSNSILRLYRAYFLRDPDRAGLAHWVAQYSSGKRSLQSISEYFARSKEFQERYGSLSNAEFVRLVYQNVLGRLPDANGERHWTNTLATGTSRGQMMVGFSESPEFQRKTGTLPADPPATEQWVTTILGQVNAERVKHGLAALTLCPPLSNSARAHSADQARRNSLSHQGSDGSHGGSRISRAGYRWSHWGENVASGFTRSDQLVTAWMQSNAHRDNILSRSFVHIGFGRVAASDGRLYWTANFGAGGTC